MKIGIDLRPLAAGRHTGVEEYTRRLLSALFELDQTNEYLLFYNAWGKSNPDFSWIPQSPRITFKRFYWPNKLLNFFLWYFRFPKLDRLIGDVDVFFLPNLNFAAFSERVRVVVVAHDLSFEYFPEMFSWKQRLWHYLINFRSLLKRADRVIAVSYSTRDDLTMRYKVSPAKIRVIKSGVDERFHLINRNEEHLFSVKQKYRLPYRFILYLGTLEPRKNLDALLSAYEKLQETAVGEAKKFELVLAGLPGWKYQSLFDRIESSPVKDKIHRLGFVAEADKPALYTLASIFVYPSFYEGFGFPPLEALGCGTPVIASHSASLPEILGDAAILIDPYRPDEILQALRQLIADRRLQGMLRQKGFEQRSRFSWNKTAQQLLREWYPRV